MNEWGQSRQGKSPPWPGSDTSIILIKQSPIYLKAITNWRTIYEIPATSLLNHSQWQEIQVKEKLLMWHAWKKLMELRNIKKKTSKIRHSEIIFVKANCKIENTTNLNYHKNQLQNIFLYSNSVDIPSSKTRLL